MDTQEADIVAQVSLPTSNLSHRLVARTFLCLTIRPEGPSAHMQRECGDSALQMHTDVCDAMEC